MHPVATQFGVLRKELEGQFLERADAIYACLLAMVTGEHVFMLGVPGTAKTQLIRAIMSSLRGHRYFEIALSRNRTMEAVIGPLDILHFRETGEYRYKREGYATAVEFALFNEIGKMSDDLGHDLLALLNERLVHEVREVDGQKVSVHDAPLMTAFCDSNEELTASASDDAAALWDRLGVRVKVENVVEDSSFVKMLKSGEPVVTAEISLEDLKDVVHNVVPSIEIPDHVYEAMVKLRRELAEKGVNPSGRRFHWCTTFLRGSAFLAGRDTVTEDDIASLRLVLWDTLEQIPIVEEICRSKSDPFFAPLTDLRKRIHEVKDEIEKRHRAFVDAGKDWDGQEGSALQMYGKEATKKMEQVRTELDAMLLEAQGRPIPMFAEIHELQQAVLIQNFTTTLDQTPEAARKMAQEPKRLGQGAGGNVRSGE